MFNEEKTNRVKVPEGLDRLRKFHAAQWSGFEEETESNQTSSDCRTVLIACELHRHDIEASIECIVVRRKVLYPQPASTADMSCSQIL